MNSYYTTELAETLKSAQSYSNHLKDLTDKLNNAQQQIFNTSNETERTIETIFNNLLTNLTNTLSSRKNALIKKVHEMKLQSLAPLEECGADISIKLEKTDKFMKEIESYLNGTAKCIDEFTQKSSSLASLPEIPELTEVPYISFHYSTNLESELLNTCSQFGEVSKIAPVQISQTTEKPGAILVEWENIENDERGIDIQEFRLQRAFGDVTKEKRLAANFTDCFVGLETQFLVKELQANQPYSFRVCCKYEGFKEWSPWSLPLTALTTIKPFSWANNEDFILANENSIAIPVKESPSLLISNGPQFAVGYSIEFTFLNFDDKCCTIGLIQSNKNIEEIKAVNQSYFALDSSGEIFVDGVKKSTKLPQITKGVKVCFTCELIHDNKVRINVDSCDKQVTYDWYINKVDKLYFAALLKSPNSKIMVE